VNWLWLLFGFNGRINRAKFWLGTAMSYLGFLAFFFVGGTISAATGFEPDEAELWNVAIGLVFLVFVIGCALAVKRLHDRNKSGWWMLILVAFPIALLSAAPPGIPGVMALVATNVISLWAVIELGFVEGTDGPNRYGPDPLRTA
jgi:uncharacterized membrane protein YhaH (DUF805 family)